MPTLAIQWARLGPYHHARLRATHDLLRRKRWSLIALETAADDRTYAWEIDDRETEYPRVRAMPERTYDEASPCQVFRAVTSRLDVHTPDVVAFMGGYSTPDARACLSWCRRFERPAVIMMESKADDATRNPMREWVKRMIVSLGDAALAGGTPQREYLEQLGMPANRIFEPYDVVDNAFFSDRAIEVATHPDRFRELPGLESSEPFFLASNRFVERKNLRTLLDCFARYRNATAKPWRLIMLGDGPLRGDLERRTREGVTFAGFRQIGELPAYYGRASAFVHPALQDQWGLVVNEAMASGLPVVVSTGAGCSRDLVAHGTNGFVFDPVDEDALVGRLRTMSELSRDELARMGDASRRIVSKWSPEAFADGMWSALQAARHHAESREPAWLPLLVLGAAQAASRSTTSFHAIRS